MKLKLLHSLFLFSLCTTCLIACKKEKPLVDDLQNAEFKIFFEASYLNENLKVNQLIQINDSLDVKIADFKFYISQLQSDQQWASYSLHKFEDDSLNSLKFSANKHALNQNFKFYFGVDSLSNHGDPSVHPNDHPLNIMLANDMHWGWDPGYVFIKIEGMVYNKNTNTSKNLSWHISRDEFYKSVELGKLNWKKQGASYSATLNFKFEKILADFSNSFSIWEKNSCHSGPEEKKATEEILNLVINAISINE